jgi:tetrahydromethanopterin S-methyltransferase subunit G
VNDGFLSRVSITYSDAISGEAITKELFPRFEVVPSAKKINMKIAKTVEIDFADETETIGVLRLATECEELVRVKVTVRLTIDGILEMVSVEGEVLPADDRADGPKAVPVRHEYIPEFGRPKATLDEYREQELAMRQVDEAEERIDFVRNELESYIFKMANGIRDEYREFFHPDEIDSAERVTAEVGDWFAENEFDRLSLDEYAGQLQKLRAFGDPVLDRRQMYIKLPATFRELCDRSDRLLAQLASDSEESCHLSPKSREPLVDDITAFVNKLKEKESEINALPRFVMPNFDGPAMETRMKDLEKRTNKLLKIKKPPMAAPPAEPEPKPPQPEQPEAA